MSTFAEQIIDDLVTDSVISAKGTDGFFSHMPDPDVHPDVMVAVFDMGGDPHTSAPFPTKDMMFKIRSKEQKSGGTYDSVKQMAAQIFTRYHGAVNMTFTDFRILSALGDNLPPGPYEDDRQRFVTVFNVSMKATALDQTINDDDGSGHGGKDDIDYPDNPGG